jgi:basic membrane protein A
MKKFFIVFSILAIFFFSCGCGNTNDSNQQNSTTDAAKTDFSVGMVTDTGSVNDQSFNQSAWEGLSKFSYETGAKVDFIEPSQVSEFKECLIKFAEKDTKLIAGIGYKHEDSIRLCAQMYPNLTFAIVDFVYPEIPPNVACIEFKEQEAAFLVGCIAGLSTKTNKIGFVGGMKSLVIDNFEFGFKSGIKYAEKMLNKKIEVTKQYAESFTDPAKGRSIAVQMFSNDVDIVFHAAGGTGTGVIEAAKESKKFAIGVDMDQSYLAPENVLTSAIKNVGSALKTISTDAMNGEEIAGKCFSFGLKDGCVGIPENNPNVNPDVIEKIKIIKQDIIDAKIVPANNLETLNNFN